jgi:hypothetical protein
MSSVSSIQPTSGPCGTTVQIGNLATIFTNVLSVFVGSIGVPFLYTPFGILLVNIPCDAPRGRVVILVTGSLRKKIITIPFPFTVLVEDLIVVPATPPPPPTFVIDSITSPGAAVGETTSVFATAFNEATTIALRSSTTTYPTQSQYFSGRISFEVQPNTPIGSYTLVATNPDESTGTIPFEVTPPKSCGISPDLTRFGLLGNALVSSSPTTVIGAAGSYTSGGISGVVATTLEDGTLAALEAKTSLLTLNSQLGSLIPYETLNDSISTDITLTPRTYYNIRSLNINGATITLDGGGDSNSQFVFYISEDLNISSGSRIVTINGASPSNVFFNMFNANISAGVILQGNVVAISSINTGAGAVVTGRLLSINQTINLNSDIITVPTSTCVG